MITVKHKGDFKKTDSFLNKMKQKYYMNQLEQYAQKGVDALASATPVDTGLTAASWYYEIRVSGDAVTIVWSNSNVNKGVNIAMILQYGHGTGTGGYVQGRDYINPAIQPIFDKIADGVWEVIKSS
ncbi:MAG: HK97 gp10 family phage protein [Clostridiales bacterium]|nr:HK97 gp10 family phage protein [Clostridiales bacterium]